MLDDFDDYMSFRSPFSGKTGYSSYHTAPRSTSIRTTAGTTTMFDDEPLPTVVRTLPFTPPAKTRLSSPQAVNFQLSPAEEITRDDQADIDVTPFLRTPQPKSHKRSADKSDSPLVQKYFNLLRQSQDSSPDGAHPQQHIMNRRFRLAEDDEHSASCSILRVLEADQSTREFSNEEDVSALVNIGDAALCRLIATRTNLASERSSYQVLCDASASIAAKVLENLHAFETASPGQKSNPELGDNEVNEGNDEKLWEISRELLRALNGDEDTLVTDLTREAAECDASTQNAVMVLLQHFVDEANVRPAQQGQVSVWPQLQRELDAIVKEEHEAKVHGNLTQGAVLRGHLVNKLYDGLKAAVENLKDTDAHRTELGARRRCTDTMLNSAITGAQQAAEDLKDTLKSTEHHSADLEQTLNTMERNNKQHSKDALSKLASNQNEILETIGAIDSLYARLESLVHERARESRNLVQSHAHFVSKRAKVAEQIRVASVDQKHKLSGLRHKERLLAVLSSAKELQDHIRTTVDATVATLEAEAAGRRLHVVSDCEKLSRELHSQATNWMDVLLKNEAREAERVIYLQNQIRDATDRYDQQDKNMYNTQLDECLERRRHLHEQQDVIRSILSDSSQLTEAIPSIKRDNDVNTPPTQSAFTTPQKYGSAPSHQTALAVVPSEPHTPTHLNRSTGELFTLLDVDQLTVEELVPLFKKSSATTKKWIAALQDCDVERLSDLREIKSTHVWDSFLINHPLLKTQLELLMESPERYFQ